MVRYTFDELKELKSGDIFIVGGREYVVNYEAIHNNESNFYGDFSESIEWSGVAVDNNHQRKFQVSNTREKGKASDPIVFKKNV
jgi:hypothetical protein